MPSVIPGDIVDAMWDVFTTGKTKDLVKRLRAVPPGEAMAVLDVSEVGPSFVGPPARYFTVLIEMRGYKYAVHLQAMDGDGAVGRARERNPLTPHAKFVREIDRNEFERLTMRPS